jgi:hypothetical protein
MALIVIFSLANGEAEERRPTRDDPKEAWEEWGEDMKARMFPKRAREVGVGANLYAALGSVMRQRKHVVGELEAKWSRGNGLPAAQALVARFEHMLTAGGIGAKVFMPDEKKLVVRTETVLDAYLSRDFLLKQAEIHRVLIDGIPFTPKPVPKDEDGDEDDDYEGEL